MSKRSKAGKDPHALEKGRRQESRNLAKHKHLILPPLAGSGWRSSGSNPEPAFFISIPTPEPSHYPETDVRKVRPTLLNVGELCSLETTEVANQIAVGGEQPDNRLVGANR